MSVHIRYRYIKEKGEYAKKPEMTRGYTSICGDDLYPFNEVLKDFYADIDKKDGVIIKDIWRDQIGHEERRMGDS